MKNTTKKTYVIDGQTVSPQKYYAVHKKVEREKKDRQRIVKSNRQRERRGEQRIQRFVVFGSIPWVRGNPPPFGTKATSKLKSGKSYAFHAVIRVTGDLSSSRGLGAIRDWYKTNGTQDFNDRSPRDNGYMIYPFLGNFTPEEMSMIPVGDVRTNAEIRTEAIIHDLVSRGAETVETKGVFVSGVMGGGEGLR